MINFLKRASGLTAVVLAAAFVAACGGVSSGTAEVPPAGPVQLMAQYEGTWTGVCRPWVPAPSTMAGSYRDTKKFGAPAADGRVSSAISEQFFDSRDCSGTVVANIADPVETTAPMGTKTVGAIQVVMIEETAQGGTATSTGSGATLEACSGNGMPSVKIVMGTSPNASTFCMPLGRTAGNFKQIQSFVTQLNTFDTGVIPTGPTGLLDAQSSYPIALSPSSEGGYTKR